MYQIAKKNPKERQALFRNTASKMGLHEAVIEKDFWVCLILNYLFTNNIYHDAFVFKGGTSLSKAYRLIQRFSEDIDLILDWRILGYKTNEPWQKRSKTQQDLFNKEAGLKAEQFLKNQLLPLLINDLSELLELDADLYIDELDPQTIHFAYPHLFENQSILSTIRLEIGALAAWTPARQIDIQSYTSEQYSKLFKHSHTPVLTVSPERTFWEKATILHHEANRPDHLIMPMRYSRHYYDIYCMANTWVKDSSLKNIDLLEEVSKFKIKFYPRNWAKYPDAQIGTLKLMPPNHSLDILEKDYRQMNNMIYGAYPPFQKLLGAIQSLESEINSL